MIPQFDELDNQVEIAMDMLRYVRERNCTLREIVTKLIFEYESKPPPGGQ